MAMDSFSYTDTVRAAFASCLPCFSASPSDSPQISSPNPTGNGPRASSSNDLEHLLRDSDSDALSLHSNLGSSQRRARKRRRPKFSLTLFGYTLFGRPPIYLSDDDEDSEDNPGSGRAAAFASSSTLDSDAAPLDASAIESLTSPDHRVLAQRERERQRIEAEEQVRRKAERRARREERKARERAAALVALTGGASLAEGDEFEGFQGSASVGIPSSLPRVPDLVRADTVDGEDALSGDADDADLGGELYARKKRHSVVGSRSGSDSRSRTSASFSAGDTSHIQNIHSTAHQSIPYPQTTMHLPPHMLPPRPKKKSTHAEKRTSTVSSATSQSTSPAPYTPVESIAESPAVAAFPVPHERYLRNGENSDFPSAGLSGRQSQKSFDPKVFMANKDI